MGKIIKVFVLYFSIVILSPISQAKAQGLGIKVDSSCTGYADSTNTKLAWDMILAEISKQIKKCSAYRQLPSINTIMDFLNKSTIYCANFNETIKVGKEIFTTPGPSEDWSAFAPFATNHESDPEALTPSNFDWANTQENYRVIILNKEYLVKNQYAQAYPIASKFNDQGPSDIVHSIFHEALHYISKRAHTWHDTPDPIEAVTWMCFPRKYGFELSLTVDQCVNGLTKVFHKDSASPQIDEKSAQTACSKPRPEYEKSFDRDLRVLMEPMEQDFLNYRLYQ